MVTMNQIFMMEDLDSIGVALVVKKLPQKMSSDVKVADESIIVPKNVVPKTQIVVMQVSIPVMAATMRY